jgi:acyl carrier protein
MASHLGHGNTDEPSARALIRELVLELAPTESVKAVEAGHRLVEDLEYHSLALMELAFTLEDEFHLDPIDEEQALKIVTVGDLERHVIDELQRKGEIVGVPGEREG